MFTLSFAAATCFISLDCGLSEDLSYTDSTTDIYYISDESYIQTGITKRISSEYSKVYQQMYWTVRSFPQGDQNCYNFTLRKGDKYIIRVSFLYGNYDGKNTVPQFDIRLGPNLWATVNLDNTSRSWEIIHVLQSKYLYVCFVNTGNGVPFVSVLELRLLTNTTLYTSQFQTESLSLWRRLDVGLPSDGFLRFKEDGYDRMWWPYQRDDWRVLNTSINMETNNVYQPPLVVMETAGTPADVGQPMNISVPIDRFYVYMHFAEIEVLNNSIESREFDVYINGQKFYGGFRPAYLQVFSLYSDSALSSGEISIQRTSNSTLPPILNAIEIYEVKNFLQSQTNEKDVDAISNIKSIYGIKRNWQGDPCAPQKFLWEGLNCSYDTNPPRIISLNLSSSNLNGEIPNVTANLSQLQQLDLSNNRLTGPVPEFLANLQFLTLLNLSRNMFNGSVPAKLMERANRDLLDLIMDEDTSPICAPDSCNNNNDDDKIVPIVASVASIVLVLIITLAVLWKLKRRKQPVSSTEKTDVEDSGKTNQYLQGSPKNRQFSHAQVQRMTNNFETVLGEGGFGKVFLGYLGETKVAVKMLSPSSVQGYKQFQAEVEVLLRVHHRNLTMLIGYCDDGSNLALIYEYMAEGNLAEHLKGWKASRECLYLTIEIKLIISKLKRNVGLLYLHHDCTPSIIHRDVKCTNILLTESLHAKLSDFGLSKAFPLEGHSLITGVAGTPGYLDPEYSTSNRLTEKSDVYSFGVVLLEIITNQQVIIKSYDQTTHISQWTSLMLSNGDIKTIVDPRLQGDFDINSMKKAVELAMACVSQTSMKRPSINYVVAEISECLSTEIERNQQHNIQFAPAVRKSLA
ncbi:putative leucine-rich repeat receptor-like protein kinase [Hibiscus syriacus]|uniref:Leucine-rich repeat receptor-like protein kinase n=1 Tax=Hibiscus syriacus TaxID=106335 RepID=A0A6A3A5H1_HIBSY|nr:putative leucine-rich repeat receptor-like protein kinase [Hibiscus syriacus]